MDKKTVYTYAKLYLKDFIASYEKELYTEALTEKEETEISELLDYYKRELESVKFEIKLIESGENE